MDIINSNLVLPDKPNFNFTLQATPWQMTKKKKKSDADVYSLNHVKFLVSTV